MRHAPGVAAVLLALCACAAEPAQDGLLLRATLDDAAGEGPGRGLVSGPAVDSVSANDPTLVPGREGKALLVAAGRPLAIHLNRSAPHRQGTIALWVQPTFASTDEGERVLFLIPCADGESADNWQMQWRPGGELLVRTGKMDLTDAYVRGLRFARGQWVHLAVAWDERSLAVYVDGRRALARVAGDLSATPGNAVYLGAWSNGDRPSGAAIDEFRVYDRRLSADEIAQLAGGATGAALPPPPPAGRTVARPGPLVAPSAHDPDLLAHLDFETWPPRLARLTKPRGGKAQVEQVEGRFGKGGSFAAGGLTVNVGDLFPLDRGTVALWVRPHWDAGHGESKVFFHVPTNSKDSTDNYHLQAWGGNLSARAGAMNRDGAPGADLNSPKLGEWRAGEWHFLALTWSPGALRLYQDGELVAASDTVAYPFRPAATMSLGCWQDGSRCADAVLDEFRLYTVDLAAEEVRLLYEGNTRG